MSSQMARRDCWKLARPSSTLGRVHSSLYRALMARYCALHRSSTGRTLWSVVFTTQPMSWLMTRCRW